MSSLPPDQPSLPLGENAPEAEAERTASGLIERELDTHDMAELRGQFNFRAAELESSTQTVALADWQLPDGLDKQQLHAAELLLPSTAAQRMRMTPLPGKVRTHALRLEQLRTRLHKDLPRAIAMPVRRARVLANQLTRAEQDAVNAAVVKKYGSAARNLTLQAVFREVPPEAAKSVRLDEALRFCQFTLPPGTNISRIQPGHALIITTGDSGKTYPALVRL